MSHPVSAKGSYLHLNEVLSIRAQELRIGLLDRIREEQPQ